MCFWLLKLNFYLKKLIDFQQRKTISIPIVEENSYQKRLTFYVQLEEPIKPNDKDRSSNHDLNVDEQIALQGKPSLGAISRLEVTITESNEFKNTVDKLVSSGPPSTIENTSWGQQFSDACKVLPDDDSDGEPATANCFDYVLHFLTLFWKLLFATVPPPGIFSGYVCFVISIIWIGVLTALIGDIASHFGCTVGLKDSVTAVTLVALGTSVPDTFASKVAAIQDNTADNSVGNVTGSNAVNVFLGIGVAWSIAAIYHWWHGRHFYVDPGNLAFSVTLFCSGACIAIVILVIRRSDAIGGELGGPVGAKMVTSLVLFCLWLFYITMSTLEAYHVIQGF